MLDRRFAIRTTAVVAGVEAALLLGYAVSIAYVAATQGLSGPNDVSSPTGVVVEVMVFVLFAAGLAAIAYGRWHNQGWSGAPFVLVQLLTLTASVPMAIGSGGGVPAGVLATLGAIVGLAALIVAAYTNDPTDPTEPVNLTEPTAHQDEARKG